MAIAITPICWVCDKPVSLEECKIDEHGEAVHENCYALRIALSHCGSASQTDRKAS
jgi:hypothetical protein